MPAARDLVAESRERFLHDTRHHKIEVMRDDGLYRHLRFKDPSTIVYYFDLVTWPGYLAIVGDCGDFVFSRTRDMFEFFGVDDNGGERRLSINPQYWSEKLQAPRMEKATRYSYDAFREHVREWLASVSRDLDPDDAASLRVAVNDHLLADHLDAVHGDHEAHVLLRDFEHNGIRIGDSWEWSLRDYDWAFLWCCWAIVYGIHMYRTAAEVAA